MELNPSQAPMKGPDQWFTGEVSIEPVARVEEPSRILVNLVRFSPGARTAWHSHALGQVLYVTEGVGRVQARGSEVVEIRPGDFVHAPPDEEHWHGAAPDHPMAHISVTESSPDHSDIWGAHVSDDEYRGGPG